MPSLPTACYRLQLRGGVDFAAAEALLPWLARLGISHLYLSPIFRAMPGSTHGYDVIDPNRIEDDLGGRRGFAHLAAAARGQGIGLILDIVPNHMAFSPHNPWLRDVLRRGRRSRWHRHFDIRTDGPLLLPMLEAPFQELLERGALAVAADPDGPVLVTGGLRVPLDPDTVAGADIATLHGRQFWRLVPWRDEAEAIAHRRFFNITGLIGLRVEDAGVLADTHRLVFDLADAGLIAGLRIDHIDGLADPGTYLRRLRARLPEMPIWVEKILAPGEALPDWPVTGTTGYELARDIGQRLTDGAGLAAIDTLYRRATGRGGDFHAVVARAKREVLQGSLAPELQQLQTLLQPLVAADLLAREYRPEVWRQALIGLIALSTLIAWLMDAQLAPLISRPQDPAAQLMETMRLQLEQRPLVFAAGQLVGNIVTVALVTRIGRFFGGHGRFEDVLLAAVWMKAMLLVLQFAQLIFIGIALPVAAMLAMVETMAFLYLALRLTQVVHGFRRPLLVAVGMAASFLALVFGASILLMLFGLTPQEF